MARIHVCYSKARATVHAKIILKAVREGSRLEAASSPRKRTGCEPLADAAAAPDEAADPLAAEDLEGIVPPRGDAA